MVVDMSKRDRLMAAVAGNEVDRPPVALWRHFPGDDQRPSDLAAATVAFQRRWDWDLVKVTPASSFCVRDWGVEDRWVGNSEGTRDYTRRAVVEPEDWNRLTALDARSGSLGGQLRCLEQIRAELDEGTPVIQTIFSPMSQAKNLAGNEFYIAMFYYKDKRYEAALERFKAIVTKYPDVGMNQMALQYMTQCESSLAESVETK